MATNTGETMATRIKRLREAAGLSQNDLAKYLGVSRVAINKYENGYSRPVRRLDKLAAILNTTADYLLTGRDASPEPFPAVLDELLLPAEAKLLRTYRLLDEKDRSVIDAVVNALAARLEPTEEPPLE